MVDSIKDGQNGSSDLLIKVTDSVASLQGTVFVSTLLHMLVHFLTHRLDVLERDLPRLVDLSAANSTPKKEI